MKKILIGLLTFIMLCSLLTPYVSANSVYFSGENGLTVFIEDFDGYEAGIDVIDSIGDLWNFEDAGGLAADNNDFRLIDNPDGGKALYFKWIYGRLIRSMENITVKSPFVFGGTLKAQGDELLKHGTHIWIRSSLEPYVTDTGKTLNEYEGDDNGDIGGYGFAIELHNNKVEAVIRELNEEAPVFTSLRYTFDLPSGVELTKNFTEFKITDDGQKITVTFAGTLIFTVEYSEEKDGFYTKAVVKDPEGNTVLESEKATLVADEKVAAVAISNRAGMFTIDDFYFASGYDEGKNVYAAKSTYTTKDNIDIAYVGATEKDWVGIYKKGTTPSAANQPIARIDALGIGAATLKAEDLKLEAGDYEVILFANEGYDVISKVEIKLEAPPTPEPTKKPTAKPAATPTAKPKDEDEKKDTLGMLIAMISLAVVAVVIIVVAIILIAKKKKSS